MGVGVRAVAGVIGPSDERDKHGCVARALLPTTAQRCGADRCGRAPAVTALAMGWE